MPFPTSPTNGQTYTVNGIVYVYSSAKTAWQIQSSGSATVPTTVGTNLSITGNFAASGTMDITGNANVGNLSSPGSLSSTGNITSSGTAIAPTIRVGNLQATGGSGNISIGASSVITGAQNSIKIPGQVLRFYYAEQTTTFSSTSTDWVNTGLSFSNVVINSDEDAIYQWYFTIRRNGATDPHIGSRLVYSGTASGNFPSENSWGFGITGRASGLEWGIHSGFVNMRSARNGYTAFNPNGTYNFQHQVKNTTGTFHIGSEISSAPEYTPNHGIVWIYKK